MKFISLVLIPLFSVVGMHAQTATVSGFVRDQNGAAVSGAKVNLVNSGSAITDQNGHFAISGISTASGQIEVSAKGFADYEDKWTDSQIDITLKPAAIAEQVTVTRSGSKLGDTPQSVILLGARKLTSTPAVTLDDKLRQVPGFTLFRRSGSRTANPTSQGVSLRGTGGSGASRAAVVLDGVPLNDPFGGWVYWGRIPLESVNEVEILRGSASELYGSSAIGGVISISSRPPVNDAFLHLETSYGTQSTPLASLFATEGHGQLSSSLGAEVFATDGFITVPKDQRGSVDAKAGVKRSTLVPTVSYSFAKNARVFTAGEYFEERRPNGTPLQNNDTKIISGRAGGDFTIHNFGEVALRGWLLLERYHQSFSSIAADRNSETLTRLQTVPSRAAGASLAWSNAFSAKTTAFGGIETRNVQGSSDEIAFAAGRPTSFVNAGGREQTMGAFIGASYKPFQRLALGGGVRVDHWREFSGFSDTRPFTGTVVTRTAFADRSETAVTPRLSALYRVNNHLSITGSYSTGFRQPTLNELYRSFRVGNVLTLANQNLGAEYSKSGEAGVIASAFGNRLYARSVGFCIAIDDPVSNVTLSSTPALIMRQRQNLGSTRSCGVEADSQIRVRNDLDISAGYLFVDARVKRFPADRTLEGLRVPQVASNQFTFQAHYSNSKVGTISVQLRAADSQFDDDQNQFRLVGFATIDVYTSRRINKSLDLFFAAENIFNDRIEAGRTPIVTITGPWTVRVGLKLSLGKHK